MSSYHCLDTTISYAAIKTQFFWLHVQVIVFVCTQINCVRLHKNIPSGMGQVKPKHNFWDIKINSINNQIAYLYSWFLVMTVHLKAYRIPVNGKQGIS